MAGVRKTKIPVVSLGAAMADIALLLLVFFMATTSTEPPKGVEVALPKALTSGAEQDNIYISIGKKGRIFYEGRPTDLENLKDLLSMRQGEKDRVVAITADKNLDYSIVKGLLDVLKESDFLNIVFMSIPREEPNRLP